MFYKGRSLKRTFQRTLKKPRPSFSAAFRVGSLPEGDAEQTESP
jgi:hypothetical protein